MSRPNDMGLDIVRLFAECVGDYARTKQLDSINIIFHGGEPLLLGVRYLEQAVQLISSNLPSYCHPIFSLQSNGSLLNRDFVEVLCQYNISISISLDGGRIPQDRHRIFANGLSSFDTVHRNIKTFLHSPEARQLFGGILAVVDLRNEPLEVFDFLSSLTTSGLDFLLPDGTHENPPPGITDKDFKYNSKYASWLIPIFDRWFANGKRKPSIRFFENILALLFGVVKSNVEGIGDQCLSLLTVETDGEIRDSDVLSVSYEHAARFGEGVYLGKGCFERLLNSEGFRRQEYLYLPEALSRECQVCDWRSICGGGLVPHRYSNKQKYDNPSIYCGNLKFFFSHIRTKMLDILQKKNTDHRESGAVLGKVNRMDRIMDFKRSWDFSLEVQGPGLKIVEGPEGNISETGEVKNPTSVTLTPSHPLFINCVEKGVIELVRVLVEDINCITYSSCQGHKVPGHDLILPRNVGVLCRDETEQLFLNDLFMAAASKSQPIRPKIFNDWVESENDLFRSVEIVFDCEPTQQENYWSIVEESYHSFLRNLKSHSGLIDNNRTIAFNGLEKQQIARNIEKIFSDYEYSSMRWESQKVVIEDCRPFYRNEALSVKYQAKQGNIAIVNNHAWSLLFWLLSVGPLLESNPSLGIHLIHIDFHSDLSSPRIFYCNHSKSFVDYFTHETIDLMDPNCLMKAIRSTAIGPGSFIQPFLYLNRKRKCKLDMIVPISPAYDGEGFNEKTWQIKVDGRSLPGAFGNTLRLAPRRAVEPQALEISCKNIFDLEIQTDYNNNLTILDIDLDFFSNRLKGSNGWNEDPGWHPDETYRLKLFKQTETFLNHLFAEGTPNVITLATSSDFCPPDVRREAFGHLNQFLTNQVYRSIGL
jgi:uncharacterized protein